ncbi:hypothetical protein HG535_0G05470 [Zygotorulaspora mrakii]|uniref:Uncharacterized protein n=1 Tax=Zygotorulaspora mrakii TaxID=42260 RepID=A0A7H9B8U0_ZYGMR|nr:uncharacterized protein HG535_0G05470 [Zygotorulaspora mrakii]QLG74664.1 hypothetical protein HG535_0G05470 [Zygotorulaspora mrakii]
MTARREFILDALNAPKFVYRYKSRAIGKDAKLTRSLEQEVQTCKYREILQSCNTFAIFDWIEDNTTRINRRYYWDKFIKTIRNDVQKGNIASLTAKLNNTAFSKALQIKNLKKAQDYRCSFFSVQTVDGLETLLQAFNVENCKLRLHSLGLRVVAQSGEPGGNSVASYIQALLEESTNMYTNINYDKLLKIAKASKNQSDQSGKRLLESLAEKGLSTPILANEDTWLLVTRTH